MADQSAGGCPAREVSSAVEHGVGARTTAARAATPPRSATGGFRHGAALVDAQAGLLDVALPYLEEGLRAGDLVAVAATEETVTRLRAELGSRGDDLVSDRGLSLLGARAPDAISCTRSYAHRAAEGRSGRLRIMAEIDFGDEPQGWREGQRYESVCNRYMEGAAVTALCVYDRRRLPAQVAESAVATHPQLVADSAWEANPRFAEPLGYVRRLSRVRDPLEDREPVFAVDDAPALAGLRHGLGAALARCVSDPEQLEDLHLATSEVAANAFRHGRRPVSARLWCADGHLVCRITDGGPGVADVLAGFRPAHGDDLSRGGMGLWLARKLWDSVDLLPGPKGFTVRLITRLR